MRGEAADVDYEVQSGQACLDFGLGKCCLNLFASRTTEGMASRDRASPLNTARALVLLAVTTQAVHILCSASAAMSSSVHDCFSRSVHIVVLAVLQVLSQDIDLLHPPVELEKAKNKRKRLVQSPNSFFMDVKCQGCFQM